MLIPDNLLQDKKVLLGITGSIAAYKSLELIRLFTKAGANVRVIMSQSAKKFITPLSCETLSSNQILDDTNESWTTDHNHIKIGEWADIFVIAPCSANTLAKISHGIADNILLQTVLASPKLKLLALSANTNMIHNPITQSNIDLLKSSNFNLIDTQTKELACKTTGDGAMAEPLEIFWQTTKALLQDPFFHNKKAFVTGGGTREKIDDVRYITNFSSGKMASALATALYCRGVDVTLIASSYENELPKKISVKKIESSSELLETLKKSTDNLQQENKDNTFLFMAAAVSDYVPKKTSHGKLKKSDIGVNFNLQLNQNIDILKSIDRKNLISIGFKAEMDPNEALNNATKMLESKNLDAVCLNILKNSSSFGTDTNEINFITKKSQETLTNKDKLSLAFEILDLSKDT